MKVVLSYALILEKRPVTKYVVVTENVFSIVMSISIHVQIHARALALVVRVALTVPTVAVFVSFLKNHSIMPNVKQKLTRSFMHVFRSVI